MSLREIQKLIGAESHGIGHAERIISVFGGFIGIALPMWVSVYYLGTRDGILLIASMGASAVLLFAAPHSPLAQPWPLVGGNVISAIVGVTCAHFIPDQILSVPLSVALAILAMHYLRCIHPPGGGTVLVAVMGGPQVYALGYKFVLAPVMLNAVTMLLAAVMVNYAFPWRRYPVHIMKRPPAEAVKRAGVPNQDDFTYALNEIGSYVDIDQDDLERIYALALKHARETNDKPASIMVGHHYSNDASKSWSVRRVTALESEDDHARLQYHIVAGEGEGTASSCSLAEFKFWLHHEVIHDNGEWHRIFRSRKTDN